MEALLDGLAARACSTRSPRVYYEIERQVLHSLDPLAFEVVRRRPGLTPLNVRMSHFRFFALDMWRRRVVRGVDARSFNPYREMGGRVAVFLSGVDPAHFECAGKPRRWRRRSREYLKNLHVEPVGVDLKDLPNAVFDQLMSHPALPARWHAILQDLKMESWEVFDPKRGSFVDWVLQRFRLRLADYVAGEEHCVARSLKTEGGRRRMELSNGCFDEMTGNSWGYARIDDGFGGCPDRNSQRHHEKMEAKIELGCLVGQMTDDDKKFLEPLLSGRVKDLKGLASFWRISSACVTKRLKRIRFQIVF
ncbi:MAG: hypothetical protein ACT4O3_04435 [Elusimicrobiota bacterium]